MENQPFDLAPLFGFSSFVLMLIWFFQYCYCETLLFEKEEARKRADSLAKENAKKDAEILLLKTLVPGPAEMLGNSYDTYTPVPEEAL
jgi:hypothetical protein